MNKNKAIVVSGNGVEKRTQVREKDREGLRFSFQVVDDHLTRGRANIDFIETRNFMFFDKNVFRRMVEEPYEMLHWELKKALGFIAYQVVRKAPFNLHIQRRCRFVKRNQAWVAVEGTRNYNTLLLPARQQRTIFANRFLDPMGLRIQVVSQLRGQHHFADLFQVRVRVSKSHIVGN